MPEAKQNASSGTLDVEKNSVDSTLLDSAASSAVGRMLVLRGSAPLRRTVGPSLEVGIQSPAFPGSPLACPGTWKVGREDGARLERVSAWGRRPRLHPTSRCSLQMASAGIPPGAAGDVLSLWRGQEALRGNRAHLQGADLVVVTERIVRSSVALEVAGCQGATRQSEGNGAAIRSVARLRSTAQRPTGPSDPAGGRVEVAHGKTPCR